MLGVTNRGLRPGTKKVTRLPTGSRRKCELIQSIDYAWRELFEAADVVSEGAVRNETDGPVYYGSTSVQLSSSAHGGKYSDNDVEELVKLLAADPHDRVRAVRIACLEAQLRAGCSIGAVRAELTIRSNVCGVRVDVDVEAKIIQQHSARSTKTEHR